MVSRILLFIFCVFEVNRMIRGYPDQSQTNGRTIPFHSREESGLVRAIPSIFQKNKDSREDVGDRDADKLVDTKNKQPSEQSIGNSRQTPRNPLSQFHNRGNINNNNNSGDNIKNKLHNYPNELISFFDNGNFNHWNDHDNRQKNVNTHKVTLPDELTISSFNKPKIINETFVPVMPPECYDETLCNNALDYPIDTIREELKKKSYLLQFSSEGNPTIITQNRSAAKNDLKNLCNSSKTWFFPKIGRNINGVEKYIMQSSDLQQWIEAEVCNEEGLPCKMLSTETKDTNTICVQKYVSHPFACLSHSGEGERDWFNVKTNCCCYLHQRLL